MKMRFLPDLPIATQKEDVLGFTRFVESIRNAICHTGTPFVYGVLGDWGSGKTSILRLLQNRLIDDFNNRSFPFVPIWFNAWLYENEANIVYPLLYAIKRDFEQRVGSMTDRKEFRKNFLQVVITSALALTDLGLRVATKHFTGEALKLKDIEDHFKMAKEHPDQLEGVLNNWADEVTKLNEAFQMLLTTYARDLATIQNEFTEEDVKFVILIDDLDRCMPSTAIALLESIKNYLSVRNCIFVLGLNPKIIYQGIRLKYQGLEIEGREYLEKILNYSFQVPEPTPKQLVEFAKLRLNDLLLEDEKREQFRSCFEGFGEYLNSSRFSNPRKIKRILNRYLLFISRFETADEYREKYENRIVIQLIIIAEYFPNLFQLFLGSNRYDALYQLKDVLSGHIRVKDFDDRFGSSIGPLYSQLLQTGALCDFTGIDNNTFLQVAREVFHISQSL